MTSLALAVLLSAPAHAAPAAVRAQWLMGTVCEITAYGPGANDAETAAFAEIARWDRILSLYKEESELSRLNREAFAKPFHCSDSLWDSLALAVRYSSQSAGAFDATVLPALKQGAAALDAVGYRKLTLDPDRRTVFFTRPGMGLDFGGLGKGLALDHAVRALKERGITAAMINFGGQIIAFGAPPNAFGWRVKVPGQTREYLVKDASVSTSGNEEKPGHIRSPFTGLPVLDQSPVTVIAPTGADADAWSTALFILGQQPPAFAYCALRPGLPPGPACAVYFDTSVKGASK